MTHYFRYVDWPDVPRYEAVGWTRPPNDTGYPRLHEHGTTMEWKGHGEPPMPADEE